MVVVAVAVVAVVVAVVVVVVVVEVVVVVVVVVVPEVVGASSVDRDSCSNGNTSWASVGVLTINHSNSSCCCMSTF